MKTLQTSMMILVALMLALGLNAQKDTTEIVVGKKKIVVIDKNAIKERTISNLEKGIATFEIEIENAKNTIDEIEKEISELKLSVTEKGDSTYLTIEKKIKNKEGEIVEQEKKIVAFEKGISEIEAGIEEIETELDKLDDISIAEDIDVDIDFDEDDCNTDHGRHHSNLSKKEKCKREDYNAHWAGFEFGFANFLNPNYELAGDSESDFMSITDERSFAAAINFMEYNIPISKRYFGITTGMGLTMNRFALSQNVDLVENADGSIGGLIIPDTERNYEKNSFNTAYLTVPALVELQIPMGKQRFYVQGGVTGSVRAFTSQKQVYFINGEKYKDKFKNDYQLSAFTYGLTARVGYGPICLFANYSMAPLFKDAQGPELYPVSVGLQIINF